MTRKGHNRAAALAPDQIKAVQIAMSGLAELDTEHDSLNERRRDILRDARKKGLDVPSLRAAQAQRRKADKNPEKFAQRNELVELYLAAAESGAEISPQASADRGRISPTRDDANAHHAQNSEALEESGQPIVEEPVRARAGACEAEANGTVAPHPLSAEFWPAQPGPPNDMERDALLDIPEFLRRPDPRGGASLPEPASEPVAAAPNAEPVPIAETDIAAF